MSELIEAIFESLSAYLPADLIRHIIYQTGIVSPSAMHIKMHYKYIVRRMLLYDGLDLAYIKSDLKTRYFRLCKIRTEILQYRHSVKKFRSLLEKKRSGMENDSVRCHTNMHNVLMGFHHQIMGLNDQISYLDASIANIKLQIEYLPFMESRYLI
jgi:hypothetical protein